MLLAALLGCAAISSHDSAHAAKRACIAPTGGKQIKRSTKGIVWTTTHPRPGLTGFPFNRWWGCSYSYGKTVRLKGFRGAESISAPLNSPRNVRAIGSWYVILASTAVRPDCSEVLTGHRFRASLSTGNVEWLHRSGKGSARISCSG